MAGPLFLLGVDWATLLSDLPRLVAVGSVTLAVGIVAAFLLGVLFAPVECAEDEGYLSRRPLPR